VGGIKEKCMAAHRNGIGQVILPLKNKVDTEKIPGDVKGRMKFHFVSRIEQVLELALEAGQFNEF